jgi:transposase
MFDLRELLRYLHHGESQQAIHDALGVSRRTVRKYQRWAHQQGLLTQPLPSLAELEAKLQASQPPPPVQTTSKVAPYRAFVEDLRRRGVECQAIYQRLRDEQGYPGSYSAVWRFVRQLERHAPEATVRVEVQPGEDAQVDFGYAGKMYDPQTQTVRRAWAFVATLSHSRHQYVEFVFDQTATTWAQLHRRAFEFFGGVPRRITLDNLKAAIVKACLEDPQVQRVYRECAEHYGFLISPCRVATPQHKGKVESGVHYVQRNFLSGRDYQQPQHHLRHANQDVLAWVRQTAGLRTHGTTKQQPLVVFNTVERAALQPLPPLPFEVVLYKEAKLHRDCHLVFEGAYYSAPYRLIGQTLWVRGTAKSVEIQANFERVALHSRVLAGQRQTVLAHLPPHKVAGLTLTPIACVERAAQIGPHTYDAVQRLLAERPLDRLRAVHRLLHLAEGDQAERLERACGRAIAFDDVSLRTIRTIFTSGLEAAPTSGAALENAEGEALLAWPTFARRAVELVPVAFQTGGGHVVRA